MIGITFNVYIINIADSWVANAVKNLHNHTLHAYTGMFEYINIIIHSYAATIIKIDL